MSVKPITPSQARKKSDDILSDIPEGIFEIVNDLIVKNLSGGRAVVLQEAIIKEAVHKGFKRDLIFENHYLDIEKHYRKAGWKVEYDKPAYNEDYEPTFTFTRNSKL